MIITCRVLSKKINFKLNTKISDDYQASILNILMLRVICLKSHLALATVLLHVSTHSSLEH